jgi:hypothetical protein
LLKIKRDTSCLRCKYLHGIHYNYQRYRGFTYGFYCIFPAVYCLSWVNKSIKRINERGEEVGRGTEEEKSIPNCWERDRSTVEVDASSYMYPNNSTTQNESSPYWRRMESMTFRIARVFPDPAGPKTSSDFWITSKNKTVWKAAFPLQVSACVNKLKLPK